MAADQAAGLTLKVDASAVKAASVELDNLTTASGKAESATGKFNETNKKTKKTALDAGEGLGKQGEALGKINTGMSKQEILAQRLGTSTKNLGFASRNAAMQLQDVVVSLDMGMPAYRVLLQQLPQVTGAFGGLGNTLRYFAGVLGPVGLAVTAVSAALGTGIAIISRSERQLAALNKTIVLTGNVSGLSADQMLRMAESGESAGRSFNKTLSTLQLLAQAGVKAGADFENLSKVVQDFAKASGQPIEDVVAQIGKLSTDPVGGLRALADQYHNVTEAQIQNVQQLVNQGKQTEAVATANGIASSSFAKMAGEIKSNAGTLENAMNAVTSAAKSMWDAILDIGRPQSSNAKEMEVRDQLQRRITAYNAEMKAINQQGGVATEAQKARVDALNGEIEALNRSLSALTATNTAQRQKNQATAEAARAQEEANQRTKTANDLATQYATNAEKRTKEMERLREALKSGAINQAQFLEYEKRINEQYKDKSGSKAAAERVNAGVKMVEVARQELAALRAAGKQQAQNANDGTRTSKAQAELNKLTAEQAVILEAAKGRTLTTSEKQRLAEYDTTIEIRKQIVEEAKRQDAAEKALKAHQQVDAYLKNQDASIKAITDGYAMSTREAANLREELQLIDRLNRTGASAADTTAAVNKLRELQEAQRGESASMFDGFSRGLKDSVDEMGTAYSQMADLTKFSFSTMTNSLNEFFTTGKFQAKDMVNTILAELVRLATSSAFKSLIEAFGKGSGGGGSLFGSIFGALTANAKGGAYAGGNLSAFSGQVVDSPTFFNYGVKAFANGAGLMGEAGPEAIMPLRRGADGKLGVAASGAGGGIMVNTTVNMGTGKTDTDVSGTGDQRVAQAFGKQITETVKAEIVKQTRPGGILFKK